MLTEEGRLLGQHWDAIGSSKLDRYLIQEVEHPAYNAQSVLIRAFFIDRLFKGEANYIIEKELYFSACACYGLLAQREGWFSALYRNLKSGNNDKKLPFFLQTESREQFGTHFNLLDLYTQILQCSSVGFDEFVSPFEDIWRSFLGTRRSLGCKVLELGCGSANDYRLLDSYGVAAFLDYIGIDVSCSNIHNANHRFPKVKFIIDDVCSMDFNDEIFDVCFAFDLYEHISPNYLTSALIESLRVTRDELWISLFNADNIPHHKIQPKNGYHWNLWVYGRICGLNAVRNEATG